MAFGVGFLLGYFHDEKLDFLEAWRYLNSVGEGIEKGWPITNLYIDVLDDDVEVFLETGEFITHDDGALEATDNSDYNVSGKTFEKAIIKLANRMKKMGIK